MYSVLDVKGLIKITLNIILAYTLMLFQTSRAFLLQTMQKSYLAISIL